MCLTDGWSWVKTNPGQPAMSGDLAKLFRHEEVNAPDLFKQNAPSSTATLLAREVIQNSWDAGRELRNRIPDSPGFEIEFQFYRRAGNEKQDLVRALALESLAERVSSVDRARIGLSPNDCLDEIHDDSSPIRLLQITERGATGMFGPWQQAKSHMYLALLSLGFTHKPSGSGGSYGYGKAGLINGSKIRTVVAYTCFQEEPDDPEVTRRLLGVTYWGPHDYEEVSHLGIGWYGDGDTAEIRPFENEEADRVASSLGLPIRCPTVIEDLGTTFLLIDTPIDPHDLLCAIERSWWPALVEGDFVTTVVDYDGNVLVPRPKRDPILRPFIDSWEIAMGRSEPRKNERLAEVRARTDGAMVTRGRLGMVTDLSGWSFADQISGPDDEPISHRSLIALTRGPRMVVEYLDSSRTAPYIRGAFIADDSIDDLLRQTEPKAHDSWMTKTDEGDIAPEAVAVAKQVINRIKHLVRDFRNDIKSKRAPVDNIQLPLFDDLMKRIVSGSAPGIRQPLHDTRPISIRTRYELRESDKAGMVQVEGTVSFSLSDNFKGDRALARYSVIYRFEEEGRAGALADLQVMPPEGVTRVDDHTFEGTLERGEVAVFRFVSAPYDSSWSGRLIAKGQAKEISLASVEASV